MIDREKVVKGLECHRIDNNHRINCADCPYYVDGDNYIRCVNDLHDDALALLKEQEDLGTELTNAVELIHKKNERIEKLLKEQEATMVIESENMYTGLPITHCPKCGKSLDRYLYGRQQEGEINFCPYCGQAVKWE